MIFKMGGKLSVRLQRIKVTSQAKGIGIKYLSFL